MGVAVHSRRGSFRKGPPELSAAEKGGKSRLKRTVRFESSEVLGNCPLGKHKDNTGSLPSTSLHLHFCVLCIGQSSYLQYTHSPSLFMKLDLYFTH